MGYVSTAVFGLMLTTVACSVASQQSKRSRTTKASVLNTEDTQQVEVAAQKGRRVEAKIGSTTVAVPVDALPEDGILTIKLTNISGLEESMQVVLSSGTELIEVSVVSSLTGKLFSRSELSSPIEFSQDINTPADPSLVKVPYVAPARPSPGETQTSAVVSSEDLSISHLTSTITLVRAQIMEPSFIATVVTAGAEVTGLAQIVAKPGEDVVIEGLNIHSRLSVELEGTVVAVNATGSTSGKFTMPDVRAGMVTVAVREGTSTVKSLTLVSDSAGDGIPIMINVAASEICSDKQFRNASGTVVQGTRNCSVLADCTADGQEDCRSNGAFRAADLAGAANKILSGQTLAGVPGAASGSGASASDAWNIRAGATVAGITGKLKVNCRNGVNSIIYNYDGALSSIDGDGVTSGTSRDPWDTIDDYNNGGAILSVFPNANLPGTWSTGNFCGGKDTAASPDDTAVWRDLTTGTCDGAGKDCIFQDKISGLQWSELQGTSRTWPEALNDCDSLNFGGHTDWRLPTQKELMDAYSHGIRSAGTTNWMTAAEMHTWFWSGSSVSTNTNNAWIVNLSDGTTFPNDKSNTSSVSCVR